MRPYHVQTAWYWSPDADVTSSIIKVKSVSTNILPASEARAPLTKHSLEVSCWVLSDILLALVASGCLVCAKLGQYLC